MRLIDADALDDTFIRLNADNWQLTWGEHKRMESVLFEMPTIDAVPVRHGKWISDAIVTYCSVCKFGKRDERRYAYCPNCGARMDGGDDD